MPCARLFAVAVAHSSVVVVDFFPPFFRNHGAWYMSFLQFCLGTFGAIHPEVLLSFDLPNPVSAVEINLEPLLA